MDEVLIFENVVCRLQTMQDVGLGYIKLRVVDHPVGGEAQRAKLATELSKRVTRPSTWTSRPRLHIADVHRR